MLFLFAPLLALFLLWSGTAFAAPATLLLLKDNALFDARSGQAIQVDELDIETIQGSTLRYVSIDDSEAEDVNIAQGIYIFDATGKQVTRVYDDLPPVGETVLLSPNGNVLAVAVSSSHQGSWDFFSMPDGKTLGTVRAFFGDVPLFWATNTSVLINVTGDDRPERKGCDSELGETPVSVATYDIATNSHTLLYPFEGLCDMTLVDYKNGLLTVQKSCNTQQQWQKTELMNPKIQTLTLKWK